MRHRPLLAVGIVVVAPVILAACAGGGSGGTPSPTPTVVPIEIPTATPTPAPTAEPTVTLTPSPVLSPCEAVPDLPTTVSDQPNLYSISVPDGWVTVTDEGALGVRVSRISVESPDFSVFVDEEEEGPFSPIYYETGAVLVIHVTTPSPPPYHFQELISESEVTIDGEVVPYHVFLEPSTWAGQLLDAHVNYGGSDYLFRFGYNPETCPAGEDLFQAMLDSFQFN